jgi:cell wall-associated NlpC family hydrolase
VRLISPQNRRRLGVLVGFALFLPTFLSWSPAGGTPIDDKKAEAARIEAQLEAQGNKVSLAAEKYNQARIKVDEVKASLDKAQSDFQKADQRFQAIKGNLADAAIWAYVTGGSNRLLSNMARSSNDDYVVRQQYLQFTAADQHRILGDLKAAKQDLTATEAQLKSEQAANEASLADAAAAKDAAVQAENSEKAMLSQVKGDLANLVAADAAAKSAADARRAPPAAANLAPPPLGAAKGSAPLISLGPPPPVSGGASAAVSTAEAQIGKPYVYGGSGPDSFDCSGLVMYAWAAGGVSLSHSAQEQYYETTRVSTSNLQPGDIVFFGSSTSDIGHDAIYVGGGMMVEAPHTGLDVREVGAFRDDLVGAGRPG